MKTALELGPADRGRLLDLDEFMAGDYQGGYLYELIDGRLYVSPLPNLPEDRLEKWLFLKLMLYSLKHARIINHVTDKARVFVPKRRGVTNPEPDIAAYRDFPLHLPADEVTWRDVSPLLAVEVLSADDPDKDLIRNLELYLQVPSIKEYWILDGRKSVERPRMLVHRKLRGKWRTKEIEPDGTYSTPLLPGFELTLNLRS
jgi:Uma2 family endonuclease